MVEKNIEKKWKHKLQTFILTLFCLVLISSGFLFIWKTYYSEDIYFSNRFTGITIVSLYTVLFYILAELYHTFKISIKRISEMVYSAVLALAITNVIIYIIMFLMTQRLPAIWPIAITTVIQGLALLAWAVFANKIFFKINKPKKSLVVSSGSSDVELLIDSYGLSDRYKIANKVNCEDFANNYKELLHGMETVFLEDVNVKIRNDAIKHCVKNTIDVYTIPRVSDVIMSSAEPLPLFHLPLAKVQRYNPSVTFLCLKRAFDILVSGLALLVFSPIMLIVGLLIKSYDKGSAFYKQVRLTKDGKEFEVLKFRSMRMDAEKDGVARLSTGKADDRITPVGKFIRATRLDELPQLINILKGDMSIVGPRPERPEIAKEYEETLPEFSLRLQAKAGLTGYAQVYGKYNTTPYNKLLMDLIYLSKPSFIEDLKICFATVKILFMSDSTEGIEEGKTNAN